MINAKIKKKFVGGRSAGVEGGRVPQRRGHVTQALKRKDADFSLPKRRTGLEGKYCELELRARILGR